MQEYRTILQYVKEANKITKKQVFFSFWTKTGGKKHPDRSNLYKTPVENRFATK